jgi:exopolysaccharide biosynthesis polyprenyl glycosylphosphotransferase
MLLISNLKKRQKSKKESAMLRENAALLRRLMMFSDLAIAAGSFLLGYFLRGRLDGLYDLGRYGWIFILFVFSWAFFLYALGVYNSFRLRPVSEVVFAVVKSGALSFLLFTGINYIFQLSYVSRLFILLIYAISVSAFIAEKIFLILMFRRVRRKGFNFRNVLIVGAGRRARKIIRQVEENRDLGLRIFGLVSADPGVREGADPGLKPVEGIPVVGALPDLPEILTKNVIDQVIFVVPHSSLPELREPLLYCETVGVLSSVAVDYFETRFARVTQSQMFDLPFLNFETAPARTLDLAVKRLADITLSAAALVVLWPLLGMVGAAVRLTSPGPVFFRQKRKGLNGRVFTLYKFRTMNQDAEERLEELRSRNQMSGPAFKMENDPRVTPLGRFLRRTSLDELPQLWNVFRGDMSLVGPRPALVNEVEQYDPWHRRRLSMRPGITCLWQIRGRSKITDFNSWIKMDLEYIDNWSLWQDLRILALTAPVVLLGTGAK